MNAVMFSSSGPNHPFVIWAACFLWLTSMFNIAWSLLLFFSVSDMLLLTGTDLVNAFVLLSGIIMLPTNVNMLRAISNNIALNHKSKVSCCPLWLSIAWIIIVNFIGATLCVHRIYTGQFRINEYFNFGMNSYKVTPKYKRVVDNVQWSLKCCGLNSYKDWFTKNWFDRDLNIDVPNDGRHIREVDSVPLSCCKSGSCTSNYLMELGPHSINTSGCGGMLHRVVIVSMVAHAIMFCTVIVVEILILKFIITKAPSSDRGNEIPTRINQMSISKKMGLKTSGSGFDEDVEEEYKPSTVSQLKIDIFKQGMIQDSNKIIME